MNATENPNVCKLQQLFAEEQLLDRELAMLRELVDNCKNRKAFIREQYSKLIVVVAANEQQTPEPVQ